MSYCSKCGQQVKEDDAFCQNCGAALAKRPKVSQKAEKSVVKRSMIGRNLVVLGVILAAVAILVRVLVQQTTNAYTNLDLVCDIGLAVGIVCIITGILFSVFKKSKTLVAAKDVAAIDISPKSRWVVTLLACIVGVWGAHRFYLRKTRTAVGMLTLGVLFGVFFVLGLAQHNFAGSVGDLLAVLSMLCIAPVGIWALIDFIFAATGNMKDRGGKPIKNW